MKFSTAILAVVAAGVANAQVLGMPECAGSCITQVLGNVAGTGCEPADIGCICAKDDFIATVGTCVRDACSPEDFEKTIQAAVLFCKADGVDVNTSLPPATATETGSMTIMPTATGNATTPGGSNGTTSGVPGPTSTDDEGAASALTAVGFGAVAGLVAAALAL